MPLDSFSPLIKLDSPLLGWLDNSCTRVVLCSGHMIDQQTRPVARFPAYKEKVVRDQIAAQLQRWDIGKSDLALCGGANGTDIIFAELCVGRGATVGLLLPLPLTAFIASSVHPAGSLWVVRFNALLREPTVQVIGPNKQVVASDSVYVRNNQRLIAMALQVAGAACGVRAVLVWDEIPSGDGVGGTADFAIRLARADIQTPNIINPAKL